MGRIEAHIENLLLRYDCVIVPGLGGFVTRFEPSFFSDDGHELFPPYRSLSFNAQLRINDGLLTQSYMNAYDTSYPKAQTLVNEDALAIREELYKNGEYDLGTLGTLQLTQNSSIIFTPADEASFFSKELYGLDMCSLICHTAEDKSESAKQEAAIESKDMPEAKPDDSMYVIRISKNAVHYTVATIAAALLYFAFTIAPSVNPLNQNVQQAGIVASSNTQQSKQSQDKKKTTKTDNKQPAQKSDNKKTDNKQQAQKSSKKHEKQTLSKDLKGKYTIVLACEVADSGANSILEELVSLLLNDGKYVQDDNMTRVIYGTYNTQSEAYTALKKLKQKSNRFAKAWVMKI